VPNPAGQGGCLNIAVTQKKEEYMKNAAATSLLVALLMFTASAGNVTDGTQDAAIPRFYSLTGEFPGTDIVDLTRLAGQAPLYLWIRGPALDIEDIASLVTAGAHCTVDSAHSDLDTDDLLQLAASGSFRLWLSCQRFDVQDLQKLAAAGVELWIDAAVCRLDIEELRGLAAKDSVVLLNGEMQFDPEELATLSKAGITLIINLENPLLDIDDCQRLIDASKSDQGE
jgi:hypothetical protein